MRVTVTVSRLSPDVVERLSAYGKIVYVSKRAVSVIMDVKESDIPKIASLPFVRQVVKDKSIPFRPDQEEKGTQRLITNIQAARYAGFKKPFVPPEWLKIAVIDTGIAERPELNVVQRVELIEDRTSRMNHGTWVAGTIGGAWSQLQDGRDVGGILPGVKLIDVPVIYSGGYTTMSVLVMALDAAADAGAHVINMSLGSPDLCTLAFENMAKALHDEGIVLVAAGGNYGNDATIGCPGSSPYTIAVGSVFIKGGYFYPSNFTPKGVDLSAPGGNTGIEAQYIASYGMDGFIGMAGTSMATPYVTAAAGILKSLNRNLNTAQVRYALSRTALKPPKVPDPLLGYGVVNFSIAELPPTVPELQPSPFYPTTSPLQSSVLPLVALGVMLWLLINRT